MTNHATATSTQSAAASVDSSSGSSLARVCGGMARLYASAVQPSVRQRTRPTDASRRTICAGGILRMRGPDSDLRALAH